MNNKELLEIKDKIQEERAKINRAVELLNSATENLMILQNDIMTNIAKTI